MIVEQELLERAARVIPAGTQTFSKARSQLPANAPSHITHGFRGHVWGSDEREYIDWTMGLGAISLGYADPHVWSAVVDQLNAGTIFGLAHPIEVEFAEQLVKLLPWPDAQVRYGKNGSDATAGAVRAARALTGRDEVLSIGYHGWQDWCCPNKTGIPVAVQRLTEDNLSSGVVPMSRDYACIIVEPDLVADLADLRASCDATGTLLIFDEVLTGFRTPGFSYAKWKGITPDLICFAKAIANGFPLSVVAGPEHFMRVFAGDVGYSFTFGGETLSIAAALATVKKMQRVPVIDRLWEVGREIQEHWNALDSALGLFMPLQGLAPRTVVRYPTLAHRSLVSQEMFRRGVMWTVGATACYAHTDDDVALTCDAITETLQLVARAKDPAELVIGPIVSHPYRTMTP